MPGRTENLHDYLIPTVGDVPPIETIIVEVPDEEGPYGAKGLGEHVLIPTAPAILGAIRPRERRPRPRLPATPDKVLAAIRAAHDERDVRAHDERDVRANDERDVRARDARGVPTPDAHAHAHVDATPGEG